MPFKIFNKREKDEEEPIILDICECGHMDLVHDGYDPNKGACTWCQCPKFKFQLKTDHNGMIDILMKRQETWKIKQENWDKDIDKEIGI